MAAKRLKHHIKTMPGARDYESFKKNPFSKASLVVFVLLFAVVGGHYVFRSFAAGAELHATPSTFASVVAQATGGDTVYLSSGDYGTWLGPGSSYSSMVTFKPEPGANPLPKVALTFGSGGDSFVTMDGLDMGTVNINGDTHDITIKNSRFIGSNIAIQSSSLLTRTPANIDIDNNYISGYNKNNSPEGRITIANGSNTNLGVRIHNNCLCDGGDSDGFQGSGNGIIIEDNTFSNIQRLGTAHIDGLQIYGGGGGMIIRRNIFKDIPNGIVAYDGASQLTVEDNLFYSPNDNPWCIVLLSDTNSVVRHNTAQGANCVIRLGNNVTKGLPPSNGTVIRNNIGFSWGSDDSGTNWSQDHNLWTNSPASGTGNLSGAPTFVGGDPSPMGIGGSYASYAGVTNFLLSSNSIGKNAASDGLDMGIRPNSGGTSPTPPPTPPPPSGPDTTPPTISLASPTSGSTVAGTSLTLTATASDNVGVAGVQFKLDGANLGSEDTSSPYSTTWDTTSTSNGSHTLTAVARDAAGNSTTSANVTVSVNNVAAPSGTLLLGNQTIQSSNDTNASGSAEAFKYTAVASGTAGTLNFYVNTSNTATALKVGIYSDNAGHPGTLLTSGTVSTVTAGAWNTANLSPGVSLINGVTYWIGFVGTGGTLAYKDASTGSCSESYSTASQTNLPATWASGQSWPSCTLSAYVLAAGSPSPKTGDLNSDNQVNIFDLSILLSDYGKTKAAATNQKCDINNDSNINIFDLSILLSNYGA